MNTNSKKRTDSQVKQDREPKHSQSKLSSFMPQSKFKSDYIDIEMPPPRIISKKRVMTSNSQRITCDCGFDITKTCIRCSAGKCDKCFKLETKFC